MSAEDEIKAAFRRGYARGMQGASPETETTPPDHVVERAIREAPRVRFSAEGESDGRFRATGAAAAFGGACDESQADDDTSDSPAMRAILAPYVADVELYAAARNAINEWRALRRSRAGVHLAAMPVDRYVACHPAVMAARGDAEFRGR